jgi:general secretion pathway protein A
LYTAYFGLREKPFELQPDPRFLYFSEDHKEAFAHLRYGVQERLGFVVITGDVGTGKTTLLNALLEELGPEVKRVYLADPGSNPDDLFYLITHTLDLPVRKSTKGEVLVALNDLMTQRLAEDERILLIIDEAQRLSPDMLEEIRLLSNIETPRRRLFQIFLVGQQELNKKLITPELRQLRQRIGVKYNLRPLGSADTGAYITHRLQVAGLQQRHFRGYRLFAPDSVKAIYKHTRGYPRSINVVCESALVTAYAQDLKQITKQVISEVVRDMEMSYAMGAQRRIFTPVRIAAGALLIILLAATAYFGGHIVHVPPGSTTRPTADVTSKLESPTPQDVRSTNNENTIETNALSTVPSPPDPAVSQPASTALTQSEQITTIEDEVFFAFGSSAITARAAETLRHVLEASRGLSDIHVTIEGYSDNIGDEQANRVMSRRRAESVKRWFLNHTELAESAFSVRGLGSDNPKYPNDTRENRSKNRRVAITLKGITAAADVPSGGSDSEPHDTRHRDG